jgi:hypothetical protein
VSREQFLHTWFNEVNRLVPPEKGDTYENFRSSPVVRACLIAQEMTSPDYTQGFTLLEENLRTCLELISLGPIPRNIITEALRQVQQMKKATT